VVVKALKSLKSFLDEALKILKSFLDEALKILKSFLDEAFGFIDKCGAKPRIFNQSQSQIIVFLISPPHPSFSRSNEK